VASAGRRESPRVLDPQVVRFLAEQAQAHPTPVHEGAVEDARRRTEESSIFSGPKEPVADVRDIVVSGLPIRLYTPAALQSGPDEALTLFLHGGGWATGSVETYDGLCRALANRSRHTLASLEYRLAPEHPFPAAVEDTWVALQWACRTAPRVAVAGDSAGATLATVAARRAREAGLSVALQLLVYPATDLSFDLLTGTRYESHRTCGRGLGLTRETMEWYRRLYLGAEDGSDPEASPILTPDLTGVAPAHIVVCDHDPLHDEGLAYAERLRAAGVPVHVSDYEGLNHGVLRRAGVIDRAHAMIDEVGAALEEALST
jgi:acetyl esterase